MFIQSASAQKRILSKSCAVSSLLLMSLALPAHSATILDTYMGSDDHGWGDVIGDSNKFDTYSMDVSLSGSLLSVTINTNFAGLGDNGLFAGYTAGNTGIGYGDLFLGSYWNPVGDAPYTSDQASNGTVWSYGFSLDNRWMNENEVGSGTLYSLDSGNNLADTLLAEDFMTGATYRNGQEIAVNTLGNVTAINTGVWTIDNNSLNFSIDLTGTSLLAGSDIALHWGPTCGNDVIEGLAVSAVPVPGAAWLFGSGLLGIAGLARRKST